jgi:hypothetical protein
MILHHCLGRIETTFEPIFSLAGRASSLVGKDIKDICPHGYTDPLHNHCAHFVSHALGYGFGLTCGDMTNKRVPGASIRVREIFPRCAQVGRWSDLPENLGACLVFVAGAGNVNLKTKTIADVPQKHVGIYSLGQIWHYGNTVDRVVVDTPESFMRKFTRAYARSGNVTLFYGSFPLA